MVAAAFVGLLAIDGLVDDLVHGRAHGQLYLALQPVGYLLLGLTVVIVVWSYRCAVAGRALGIRARRDPALVVVGWLVPVINLWWPYQTTADFVPDGRELQPTLRRWWTCYIVVVPLVPVLSAIAALTSWRLAAVGLVPLSAFAVAAAVWGRRIARDVLAIHEREITALARS